ncbi:MAG TPA: hypothetical protein VKY74_14330, partial [Chloroflexia bacterium]|nr:hypothetical protein [Chloroflexia bacterium]
MSNRPVRPAPAGPRLRPVLGLLGLGLLLLIALPFLARPGAAPAPAGTPPPTLAPPPTAGRATATPPGEIPPPLPDPTAVATLPPVATRALVPTGATPTAAPGGPTVPAAPTAADSAFSPAATLAALQQAPVPARDLYTLTRAVKLRTTAALPRTLDLAPRTYRLGDTEVFAVGDTANGSYYTITATLREITPHAYWWVAAGNDIDLAALQQSAGRFESRIYPSDRATFGEPPDPGVDNDSHINVLNTAISGALGYFSAADMYTRAVNPFSNQRKMIYAG